jgi:hypothetical protein
MQSDSWWRSQKSELRLKWMDLIEEVLVQIGWSDGNWIGPGRHTI